MRSQRSIDSSYDSLVAPDKRELGPNVSIAQVHPQLDLGDVLANVAETPHDADWQRGVYLSVWELVTASRLGTSGFVLRSRLV